jgi:hypothetical protein
VPVLRISAIAAEEDRNMAIIDTTNAIIQSRVEREENMVTIRVQGYLAKVLCKIDPNDKRYVSHNKKGGKQLLMKCLSAIYGIIIASLLYYNKFVKTLENNEFELNPYILVSEIKLCKENNRHAASSSTIVCGCMWMQM